MNVRGTKLGQNGVRVLNTLRGIRPVANIDGRVEYEVGRTTLETGQTVLTFEIFSAALRIGVQLVVFPADNRLQSLSWFLCGGGSLSVFRCGRWYSPAGGLQTQDLWRIEQPATL